MIEFSFFYLGTVVETSDKLICYVNKNKFKKFQNKFYCYGINKSNLELANMYNLNKPICYLFDNINMDNKMLVIHGYNNVEVMITNSDLKNLIQIFILMVS